jgi:acid phosphatase type 7
MHHHSSRGFGAVEVLIFICVLIFAALICWRVYQAAPMAPAAVNVPAESAKRVVALGDMVCDLADPHSSGSDPNYCQDAKTAKVTERQHPDALLLLGDLQYSDGAPSKFTNAFDKNWQAFKNITYPTPGNHEYATPNAAGYYAYFKDGTKEASQPYYTFNLGGWQLFSLNSNCNDVGGCGAESAQVQWLETELSKSKARCTLAFWHHPRFTSGKYARDVNSRGRSEQLWATLASHKADVVLSGHDHLYERFAPQTAAGEADTDGMRQFVVGTGGASLYKRVAATPNSEKVVDDSFGMLLLELFQQAYKWEFKNTDGQVLDSGYQQCSG